MSKRARITLDLDPEPTGAEPVAAATPKTALEGVATAGSGADEKAQGEPKARVKAKPRAKPRAKPKAAAAPIQERSQEPGVEAGAEPQQGRAANPEADAGHRPYVAPAPQAQAGSGFENDPARAAQPSSPPPGALNLGTVLKLTVVGLVVVSVVLWLKRKP